ncbi:MAG TPA: ABC transporter substrate-binding protein [Candidatus Sulfotelmatobacter sp.]|nr:ABC transporter substrate-binding protein [Candidatus Sulfotelmatobacter sp.]
MRRGTGVLLAFALGALGGAPPAADAQQGTAVPRVGFLLPGASPAVPYAEAFRLGLTELGYTVGRDLLIEYRSAEGRAERLQELVAGLVRVRVALIVTSGEGALAAKGVTSTVPIVMAVSADPVGAGLVADLARPGGNITGLTLLAPGIVAKRLELAKEVLPDLTRAAVLWNPNPLGRRVLEELEAAAKPMGIAVQAVEARGAEDLPGAFAAMAGAGAVVVLADPLTIAQRGRIMGLALSHKLPAISDTRQFADAGGLVAYGPSLLDSFRRAATYVDKILKGAKPADLPVEQPTRFELVVNLQTAKALGLTIPRSILDRADHVIQ